MFQPRFTVTPAVAKALMEIEASRQAVAALPLTVTLLESLRRSARLLSTHYSTQIEGNRLTPRQVEDVLAGGGRFPGRERDEAEVRHYYLALEYVEALGRTAGPVTERIVRTVHGLVMGGKKRATPYRDGQNVIRDGRTGAIVYLPPEAGEVPRLMKDLVAWIAAQGDAGGWPAPVVAGLAHYQFATIHPFFDGNGRTARLLANLVLHRAGYGLRGIYSLEEYYARDLSAYYGALNVGGSHNYYFGRADADVTKFVEYFTAGMAVTFARVRARAEEAGRPGVADQSPRLRELDARQRRALSLFLHSRTVAAKDVAAFFDIPARSASALCVRWSHAGFLRVADPSKKARRYRLAPKYERLLGPGP